MIYKTYIFHIFPLSNRRRSGLTRRHKFYRRCWMKTRVHWKVRTVEYVTIKFSVTWFTRLLTRNFELYDERFQKTCIINKFAHQIWENKWDRRKCGTDFCCVTEHQTPLSNQNSTLSPHFLLTRPRAGIYTYNSIEFMLVHGFI